MTLVLFLSVDLKCAKCLRQTVNNNWVTMGSDIGQATSEMRRVPSRGCGLFYTCMLGVAGTDLVQPIRVVPDSCVKG